MKMKITLALAFVLCLVLSAFAQDTMKKDDKMSKKMTAEQALTDKEQMAWKNLVDKKYDDFAKMFADDYQGVYEDEVATKTSELAGVKQVTFKTGMVSDIKVKMLDSNTALVTSTVKSDVVTPDGQTMSDNLRATTIYVKRGKDWLIVYHSHMPIKPM